MKLLKHEAFLVPRERHLFILGQWKIRSGRNMISNEADSKTYVMQTSHNHAQEFAKVAPELGSNTTERHDTATHYMQRTSGKLLFTPRWQFLLLLSRFECNFSDK